MADTRVALEIAWVDQIQTARVGQLSIDHHDFSVHAQIETDKQHMQQPAGQRCLDQYASFAHSRRQIAPQECPAAQSVDQNAAIDAARAGAHERLGHVVGRAAQVPNVELKVARLLSLVDVFDDSPENFLPLGDQFQVIARLRGQPQSLLGQQRERLAFHT